MRFAKLVLIGTACALASVAAQAHHAFATESWITIEVTGENGEAVSWMIEGGSPNALVRRGVTKASIPIGSELVVRGYQARDGSNRAVGRDLTFADGRELFFQGTQSPGQSSE